MELNDYEKSLVNGDYGSDVKRLMEIMLKIGEVKQATDLIDRGFSLLAYNGDLWLYQQALASGLAAIRSAAKG